MSDPTGAPDAGPPSSVWPPPGEPSAGAAPTDSAPTDPAPTDPALTDPASPQARGAAGEPATPDDAGDPDDAGASDNHGDPAAAAVAVVAKERDDYRDALQHLQADFENYRKRVQKQQDELRDRAHESLVEKLLPVLDNADYALAHGAGEDIKQLSASLFAALEKEGLERIDNAGEAFDPTLHDAVAHEPGDGGGQEVAEVLRAGYRWRGRVIRPAMVKVRG